MTARILHPRRCSQAEITAHLQAVSPLFWAYKTFLDWLVLLMLLPGLLFCMAILLICNPIWNRGPMFFRQPRVGRNGVIFHVFKFRTMEGQNLTPKFEPGDKKRINRLGAFMRRTRVDEVPQILNVLRGDMSVIGPRPEQISFTQEYIKQVPGFDLRLLVKPGISGLAQLKLGYTADAQGATHKLRWDMIYIAHMGFAIETHIALATCGFVMRRLARTVTRFVPLGRNTR